MAANLRGYPGGIRNKIWNPEHPEGVEIPPYYGRLRVSRPDPAMCRLDYTPRTPQSVYPSIQSDDSPYYHLGQPHTFMVIGFHPERLTRNHDRALVLP